MADFKDDGSGLVDIGSSVTPQEGVVSEPILLQGANDLFKIVGEGLESKREKKGNPTVNRFVNTQLGLIQAVDQGKYTSQFARTNIRNNLMQAISQYPALRDELIKANKDILGNAGMGGIINDGTKEEIRREKLRADLVEKGLVSPTATQPEFEKAEEDWRVSQEAERRLKVELETIQLERAKIGLTKEQMAILDSRQKKASEDFLISSAPNKLNEMGNYFDRVLTNPELDSAAKVQLIEERMIQFEAETAPFKAMVGTAFADSMNKVFVQRKDLALRMARGELNDAAVKREIERINNLNIALSLRNPILAKAVALSKIAPNLPYDGQEEVTDAMSNFFAENVEEGTATPANVFSDDTTARKGFRGYTNALGKVDQSDAEQVQEKDIHLKNIFEGVVDYQTILKKNPKAGIELIDWMSSTAFLKEIQANPDRFTNLDQVQEVLKMNYADEVWGMVKKEFKDSDIVPAFAQVPSYMGGNEPQPTPEAVAIKSGPDGVVFSAMDSDNSLAVRKAEELNKTLKPIINKTVKAMAHLEGRTDYGKAFEEASEAIFGGKGADDLDGGAGGDTLDDLSLDDFSFPKVSGGQLPEEVQQDTEFLSEVENLAEDLDVDPSVILAVMDFETGGSFSPSQKNQAGSSGTGLIQFMAATAKGLGTSTEELSSMTRKDQMKFVRKYFEQYKDKISGGDARDVYMAVLFPRAIDKPDNYVLFKQGTKAYRQNKGLDRNKDGTITKSEAARKVVGLVGKYEN